MSEQAERISRREAMRKAAFITPVVVMAGHLSAKASGSFDRGSVHEHSLFCGHSTTDSFRRRRWYLRRRR